MNFGIIHRLNYLGLFDLGNVTQSLYFSDSLSVKWGNNNSISLTEVLTIHKD